MKNKRSTRLQRKAAYKSPDKKNGLHYIYIPKKYRTQKTVSPEKVELHSTLVNSGDSNNHLSPDIKLIEPRRKYEEKIMDRLLHGKVSEEKALAGINIFMMSILFLTAYYQDRYVQTLNGKVKEPLLYRKIQKYNQPKSHELNFEQINNHYYLLSKNSDLDDALDKLTCPITLSVFKMPITIKTIAEKDVYIHTYEKSEYLRYLEAGATKDIKTNLPYKDKKNSFYIVDITENEKLMNAYKLLTQSLNETRPKPRNMQN